MGDLTCRKVSDGSVVWHVNFEERFGVKTPIWGHSSAPWIEGKHLICNVGGQECGVVAFDKSTGETAWKALSLSEPGYCAPVGIDNHGERQVVAFHPRGATAFNPATGEVRWQVEVIPNYGMSSSPPRLQGNRIFISSYGSSAMADLTSATTAKVAWRGDQQSSVYTSNAPSVFDDDAIYGFDAESSLLMAVDPSSGDRLWESPKPLIPVGDEQLPRGVRHGTGFLVKHTPSGTYYIFTERGELIHARLTREGYQELGRAAVVAPTNEAFRRDVVWVHPAFANGGMVVRNDKEVVFVGLGE
jgi:outer membrane protein assembly factor BamB